MRRLEAKNLTLEKAINLCRIFEDTEGEMRKLKLNERINAVYKAKPQGKVRPKSKGQGNKSFNKPPTQTCSKAPVHSCGKCGTTHAPQLCPAYGKEYYKCTKRNHYAKFCRSEKAVYLAKNNDSDNEVLHIRVENVDRRLLADLSVKSVGRSQNLKALGSPPIKPSQAKLTMYDGTRVKSKGRCDLQIVDSSEVDSLTFDVVETKHATLLSLATCLKLHLITVNEHVHLMDSAQEIDVNALRQEYVDVFTGLGCVPGEYSIVLNKAIPPVQNRPRKVAYVLKEDLQKSLARATRRLELFGDQKSKRVSERMHRPVGNHFPLPTIEEVLPSLKDAQIFSLVDAKDGFVQVRLTEESSYLTTFWTPGFGGCECPSAFQAVQRSSSDVSSRHWKA